MHIRHNSPFVPITTVTAPMIIPSIIPIPISIITKLTSRHNDANNTSSMQGYLVGLAGRIGGKESIIGEKMQHDMHLGRQASRGRFFFRFVMYLGVAAFVHYYIPSSFNDGELNEFYLFIIPMLLGRFMSPPLPNFTSPRVSRTYSMPIYDAEIASSSYSSSSLDSIPWPIIIGTMTVVVLLIAGVLFHGLRQRHRHCRTVLM